MKPVKIYAENIEETALEQFNSALELDCVTRAALMPDAHTGYSLPIGSAVESDQIVFPSWVGYDIGCGMSAIPTSFTKEKVEQNSKDIFHQIYRDVPTGFTEHNDKQSWNEATHFDSTPELEERYWTGNARNQLGTLGGGNHFIEVGYDENNQVWIIIHSGSRKLGHRTAERYMKIAAGQDPEDRKKAKEGHYGFAVDSENGENYIKDLNFCLQYALANRRHMIENVIQSISRKVGGGYGEWDRFINRNHNHAEDRKDDGKWIHRKGATHAESGMDGVIPGNMRDGSFIVVGKGNPESLYSSSHGAGRVLSRSKARKTLNVDDFVKDMEGITARVEEKTLDESSSAYKNIFEVMELQKDLVNVVTYVKPIINVKG